MNWLVTSGDSSTFELAGTSITGIETFGMQSTKFVEHRAPQGVAKLDRHFLRSNSRQAEDIRVIESILFVRKIVCKILVTYFALFKKSTISFRSCLTQKACHVDLVMYCCTICMASEDQSKDVKGFISSSEEPKRVYATSEWCQ